VLLKNAAIDDFTDQGCHSVLLGSLSLRREGFIAVGWSDQSLRPPPDPVKTGDSHDGSVCPETLVSGLVSLAQEAGQGVGERLGLLHVRQMSGRFQDDQLGALDPLV